MRFLPGIILASLLCWASASAQLPARTIILGAIPEAPLKWEVDGRPVGIDIDIMDAVLPRLGAPDYAVHFFESSSRLLREMKLGNVDLVLSLSYSAERAKDIDYPTESHLDLDWRFFIRRADAGRIQFTTLADLQGLRVGATRGFAYTPEFWAAGLTLDVVEEDTLHLQKLLQNRIDIVPLQTLKALHRLRSSAGAEQVAVLPQPLRSAAYYHVWSKAADLGPDRAGLLAAYDRVLREMKAHGEVQAIIDRYTR